MNKKIFVLALILGVLGMVSFAGAARADGGFFCLIQALLNGYPALVCGM